MNDDNVLSVFQFNSLIDNALQSAFPIVSVQGEVSKITIQSSSGHWYFSIKDERASLDCVLFRFNAIKQTFTPKIGDKIIVIGTPNVYSGTGRFQLKCIGVKKVGLGSLLEIIEENKKKWENTYFKRPKRTLPLYIRNVVLITSPTGEVLHDVLTNIGEDVNVKVFPSIMQGDMCADSVSSAIYKVNELYTNGELEADVLIVARGGGSFEDLYPFNDEKIVKALSESSLICISAIGHDPDTPLCDYAADIRANTPTQAGAFIKNQNDNFKNMIQTTKEYIEQKMLHRIENAHQKNDYDRNNLYDYTIHLLKNKINDAVSKVQLFKAYSPFDILKRGYSIAQNEDGLVINSVSQLKKDTLFNVILNDGTISALSKGVKK